jgi:hypothetical protein
MVVALLAALIALPQVAIAQTPAPAKPTEAAPQPSSTQKLEQLKSLLSEGLITQAVYQNASQQIVNELAK